MRYIAAVVLDGFYAASLPGGRDAPTALHRDKRVLDASPDALARGVRVGMPLSEARSVLPDGRFVLWEHEAYQEAQGRWLGIVAEYSDVVEPLRQHEALADLSGHPRPREAAERLGEALRRAGFAPRLGLAPCRWVARLAARQGDPLGLAQADPRSYVADVPVGSLPIEPTSARRLELLGYRTAGDLAALSADVLRAQFGQEAHGIAQAALGSGDAQVRPLFPADSAAARFTFDAPPETRQALDEGLGWLARGLGAALRDRDAQGRTVELFLEHEDASVTKHARTFVSALTCEHDIRNALGLMLPRAPERAVVSVRARLPELSAARRVQLDVHGGRSKDDQDESVKVALAHVRGVYGEAAVRLVSQMNEPRWVRVRRAYRELNAWTWG